MKLKIHPFFIFIIVVAIFLLSAPPLMIAFLWIADKLHL